MDQEKPEHKIARLELNLREANEEIAVLSAMREEGENKARLLEQTVASVSRRVRAYQKLKFPVNMRKTWNGLEVQRWLENEVERIEAGY